VDSLSAGSLQDLQLAGPATGGDLIDGRIIYLFKQSLSDRHGEVEIFPFHSKSAHQTAATVGKFLDLYPRNQTQ
jgi:hypothetical protein